MTTVRIPGISIALFHEDGSVIFHNDGTVTAMNLENPEHLNEHTINESWSGKNDMIGVWNVSFMLF